ncbi:MAG: DUF2061 domain-containing protein [Gammaproteobacteria bacterium]
MKESHLRSIMKAFSWRVFATLTTMVITYFITGEISFAIYVGLFEFVSKIVLYYFHERLWGIIPFGLPKSRGRELAGAAQSSSS